MNCPNCRAVLSCGCQRRTATDGKQLCSSCLQSYEQNLKKNNAKLIEQLKQAQQNKPK
jgi:hypothetical protein